YSSPIISLARCGRKPSASMPLPTPPSVGMFARPTTASPTPTTPRARSTPVSPRTRRTALDFFGAGAGARAGVGAGANSANGLPSLAFGRYSSKMFSAMNPSAVQVLRGGAAAEDFIELGRGGRVRAQALDGGRRRRAAATALLLGEQRGVDRIRAQR